jgi:hypothetical protein
VAFLGNAVHGLQEAFVLDRTALGPRLPIFLSQATGWWPTVQTTLAQVGLAFVYLVAGIYGFVVKPRRDRPVTAAAPDRTAAAVAPAGERVPAGSAS